MLLFYYFIFSFSRYLIEGSAGPSEGDDGGAHQRNCAADQQQPMRLALEEEVGTSTLRKKEVTHVRKRERTEEVKGERERRRRQGWFVCFFVLTRREERQNVRHSNLSKKKNYKKLPKKEKRSPMFYFW